MDYRGLDETVEQVWRTMNQLLQASTFYLAASDKVSTIMLKVHNRKEALLDEGVILPYEHSYCSLLMEGSMEALMIGNVSEHHLTSAKPLTTALKNCSFIGVPVTLGDGRIFGTLCALDDSSSRVFDDKDAVLLSSMSALIGYAVEWDLLQGELQLMKELAARARESVEQANAEKSLYLKMISHGIRTPLNGVIGMTSLLQDTDLSEEQQDYARIVQLSGEELMVFLNDVVDLAEIEAGTMLLDHLPFDLYGCVDDIMDRFAGQLTGNGIRLESRISPHMPAALFGDQARICQILVMAVGNALKYTTKGIISLSIEPGESNVSEHEMELLIRVGGTHTRIPTEKIELLLHNFAALSFSHRGTDQAALGLEWVISRRLVEMMNGRIWVDISEEQGTTLYFSIKVDTS
ncbi:histidine kinase dimerization/phospho-acceptor domain-containing protein [Paenibacillus sepulcri]|uniref:histidine kinase n=1 Tax=Paenibacillus sepulcri TaxID=359917 RepID=A0ABS7BZ49_9BACL|nr:hypothetical protein [Paenibacillus sepulcri]